VEQRETITSSLWRGCLTARGFGFSGETTHDLGHRRISSSRPPSARLIIIVESIVWRLRRRSSAGRRMLPTQLGIGAVKRAMLPIEVHRHPAVIAILDYPA
jgi:hypothetical protein